MALVAPTYYDTNFYGSTYSNPNSPYYAPTTFAPSYVNNQLPYYGQSLPYSPFHSITRDNNPYSRSLYLKGPLTYELDETIRQKKFHQASIDVQEQQAKKAEEQALFNARQLEKHMDWPRETDLKKYYKPSKNFHANPWIAPWVFPDGVPCFYCKGNGFRDDIGLPGLPCRGCGNEDYLKPSTLIDPQCLECNGEGVWKETYCIKCGGKGLGAAYLPFKCPKTCGARARTNWEIELHLAHSHGPITQPRAPTGSAPTRAAAYHTAPLKQPFVLPFGKNWYPREFPKDYSYRMEQAEAKSLRRSRARSHSRSRPRDYYQF